MQRAVIAALALAASGVFLYAQDQQTAPQREESIPTERFTEAHAPLLGPKHEADAGAAEPGLAIRQIVTPQPMKPFVEAERGNLGPGLLEAPVPIGQGARIGFRLDITNDDAGVV